MATAEAFRALVAQKGLEQAYAATHVVVASAAEFTNQASLLLQLGPTDPPMRIRHFRLGPAEGQGGHGNTDLLLPLGQGVPWHWRPCCGVTRCPSAPAAAVANNSPV